jgi:hypothetical protein
MTTTFVIRGENRRKLKRELHELKRLLRYHPLINDVDEVYGGGMNEQESKEYTENLEKEIKEIENRLKETNTEHHIWTRKN